MVSGLVNSYLEISKRIFILLGYVYVQVYMYVISL